jgi:hypothetical protein
MRRTQIVLYRPDHRSGRFQSASQPVGRHFVVRDRIDSGAVGDALRPANPASAAELFQVKNASMSKSSPDNLTVSVLSPSSSTALSIISSRNPLARRFWNKDRGCLYDVITGRSPDPSIRPNQIFYVPPQWEDRQHRG